MMLTERKKLNKMIEIVKCNQNRTLLIKVIKREDIKIVERILLMKKTKQTNH